MDNLLGLIVGDGRNFILEINKTNNYVGTTEEKWCTCIQCIGEPR